MNEASEVEREDEGKEEEMVMVKKKAVTVMF